MEQKAHEKLRAWLSNGGRKITWFAKEIQANRSTVHAWLDGDQTPTPIYRTAIAHVTGGEIAAELWIEGAGEGD